MGKGKGMIERQVLRVKKNQKIFEFSGLSIYRINKFCLNLNKKTKLSFFILNLNKTYYNL